jgi:hypothetical protein
MDIPSATITIYNIDSPIGKRIMLVKPMRKIAGGRQLYIHLGHFNHSSDTFPIICIAMD